LKILCLSLVFDVQKGKFLAAEKFALLPALGALTARGGASAKGG